VLTTSCMCCSLSSMSSISFSFKSAFSRITCRKHSVLHPRLYCNSRKSWICKRIPPQAQLLVLAQDCVLAPSCSSHLM